MPITDRVTSLAGGCCGFLFLVGLWCGGVSRARAEPSAPSLSVEGDSGAGHVRVSWSAEDDATGYELQRAAREDFSDARVHYRGQHTASVLSGLLDGRLYFRVRARSADGEGPWSEAASFEVRHHPRDMALSFFFAGALIFVMTAGFLWFFSRRVKVDD